jgi:hypothetical protein
MPSHPYGSLAFLGHLVDRKDKTYHVAVIFGHVVDSTSQEEVGFKITASKGWDRPPFQCCWPRLRGCVPQIRLIWMGGLFDDQIRMCNLRDEINCDTFCPVSEIAIEEVASNPRYLTAKS